MECRFAWRTGKAMPAKGPASRVGGNCWSRGQKSVCFWVLLRWSVDCHQLDLDASLCAVLLMPIRVKAHCHRMGRVEVRAACCAITAAWRSACNRMGWAVAGAALSLRAAGCERSGVAPASPCRSVLPSVEMKCVLIRSPSRLGAFLIPIVFSGGLQWSFQMNGRPLG